MRGWVVASWVALVLLLLSGAASAHPAGTTVSSDDGEVAELPPQTFAEAFCLPMCDSQARQQGNVPPVLVVESGTTLTWQSIDTYHTVESDTETDVWVKQNSPAFTVAMSEDTDGISCLDEVPIWQGSPPSVEFLIREDGLYTFDHTLQEPEYVPCDEAAALPDGSYMLATHCGVHPTYQHQLIHVIQEAPI